MRSTAAIDPGKPAIVRDDFANDFDGKHDSLRAEGPLGMTSQFRQGELGRKKEAQEAVNIEMSRLLLPKQPESRNRMLREDC
jgi:hypothetical protein